MSDGFMLSAAFDASSLAAFAHFSNFQNFLEPEMSVAMQKIGDLLVQTMQANTETAFKAPTGQLASSISDQLSGPMEVIISVDVPYANRLEYGFGPGGSAATDSLGRTYHNPPEPYANPALQASEEQIALLMDEALSAAFIDMGV